MHSYRALVEAEIDAFLAAHVDASEGGRVPTTDLYAAFSRWWDARLVEARPWAYTPPAPSMQLVCRIMGKRVAIRRTRSGNCYLGIELL